MLASTILSFCQGLTAEPFQDRFTDVQWYQWISQAQREVARETRAIEGRVGIQVQVGLPEYSLPRMVSLKRVYIAGPGWSQRITHTSIPQMEGDQLRIYDQTAPMQTPQWLALPPAPYPVANCAFNTFGYNPLPMFPGQRPQYYLRGIGRIGLVPAPLGNYWLVLDIYEMPAEINAADPGIDEIQSPFPDDWVEALAWYALRFAYHSDQETGDNSLESDALTNYNACLAKLQSYVSNINEDDPQGPQILTHRAFYEANAMSASGYGAYD